MTARWRAARLEHFARRHQLKIGTIADLIRYRLQTERSVERIAEQTVSTAHGNFRLYCYEDHVNRDVHLALVHGDLAAATPLVRVHVTDTLRDLVGVRDGSQAWTLPAALQRIARSPCGVVVILRQREPPRELADAVRSLAAPRFGRSAGGLERPRAAHLWHRRADPARSGRGAHARAVGAQAAARHLGFRAGDRRLRRRERLKLRYYFRSLHMGTAATQTGVYAASELQIRDRRCAL